MTGDPPLRSGSDLIEVEETHDKRYLRYLSNYFGSASIPFIGLIISVSMTVIIIVLLGMNGVVYNLIGVFENQCAKNLTLPPELKNKTLTLV